MALKLIGNTIAASVSTGNTVATNYGNGATFVYVLNTSTASANVTVGSNTTVNTGNIVVPSNAAITIIKLNTDLIYASNTLVFLTPCAPGGSALG